MNLSLVTCSKVCKFFLKIQKKNLLISTIQALYAVSYRYTFCLSEAYEWEKKLVVMNEIQNILYVLIHHIKELLLLYKVIHMTAI